MRGLSANGEGLQPRVGIVMNEANPFTPFGPQPGHPTQLHTSISMYSPRRLAPGRHTIFSGQLPAFLEGMLQQHQLKTEALRRSDGACLETVPCTAAPLGTRRTRTRQSPYPPSRFILPFRLDPWTPVTFHLAHFPPSYKPRFTFHPCNTRYFYRPLWRALALAHGAGKAFWKFMGDHDDGRHIYFVNKSSRFEDEPGVSAILPWHIELATVEHLKGLWAASC